MAYGDAYGGLGEVEFAGYRPYVQTVRNRVEEAAVTHGWKLDKMSVARRLRKLIHMAHEEGISDLIDL
jgi:GNAT superfamily N-acetyltransferase